MFITNYQYYTQTIHPCMTKQIYKIKTIYKHFSQNFITISGEPPPLPLRHEPSTNSCPPRNALLTPPKSHTFKPPTTHVQVPDDSLSSPRSTHPGTLFGRQNLFNIIQKSTPVNQPFTALPLILVLYCSLVTPYQNLLMKGKYSINQCVTNDYMHWQSL